jgi:hypothetical protein
MLKCLYLISFILVLDAQPIPIRRPSNSVATDSSGKPWQIVVTDISSNKGSNPVVRYFNYGGKVHSDKNSQAGSVVETGSLGETGSTASSSLTVGSRRTGGSSLTSDSFSRSVIHPVTSPIDAGSYEAHYYIPSEISIPAPNEAAQRPRRSEPNILPFTSKHRHTLSKPEELNVNKIRSLSSDYSQDVYATLQKVRYRPPKRDHQPIYERIPIEISVPL